MHRPTLILRRFGPLTFGIGYYEDGTWVDHAADTARAVPASNDVVHEWLGCCDTASSEPIPIGEAVMEQPRLHVAAR